jgi:hypothetical protein
MAEAVVLAIGTQGNPNLMRCPGADLPHVTYQLDDPYAVLDEHIVVVGTGDAGIENARGLAEDPAQGNVVTVLNRSPKSRERPRKFRHREGTQRQGAGGGRCGGQAAPSATRPRPRRSSRAGSRSIPAMARSASAATGSSRASARHRRAASSKAAASSSRSNDRLAFPTLSPQFESTAPGIFVIGALAGYPLIKHCMNQGYDVIEFINGNTDLKPADEPLLEAKFAGLPGKRSVAEWLELLRTNIAILNGMTTLQLREFMLDSDARFYQGGRHDLREERSRLLAVRHCRWIGERADRRQ